MGLSLLYHCINWDSVKQTQYKSYYETIEIIKTKMIKMENLL